VRASRGRRAGELRSGGRGFGRGVERHDVALVHLPDVTPDVTPAS
jgi:hypothetical protein